MDAFSLETARRIIGMSTQWALSTMPQHPNFQAYAALCERYLSSERSVLSLIGVALELGAAIGTHNERARRKGEEVTPVEDDGEAAKIVARAKEKNLGEIVDTSSARYQMIRLIMNMPNSKVQTTNSFLSAFLSG